MGDLSHPTHFAHKLTRHALHDSQMKLKTGIF